MLDKELITEDEFNAKKQKLIDEFINDMNHPLRIALSLNDLLDWAPKAPMKIYHSDRPRRWRNMWAAQFREPVHYPSRFLVMLK